MDKWLEQFTDNRNFMKLVALVLALLLFSSVYDGSKGSNDINVPGKQQVEAVANIPVKSYFDTNNLVITGVPKAVTVTLKGPTPSLQVAKTQKDFEVYADLSKVKVGKQKIKLKVKNLSDKLKATIKPKYITVDVQEKVTKEYAVDAEFSHKMIAEGYEADHPIVKPYTVNITGGKEVIDRIAYVKAILEMKNTIKKPFEGSAVITVLDKNLNKLDVTVDQPRVRVFIPVKRTNKTVPIKIVKKGSLPEGITVESIKLDKEQATIFGDEDALNKTDSVQVEIDMKTITESKELSLPLIISDDLKEVNPKTVKATIKIKEDNKETMPVIKGAVKKTFPSIPIKLNGLSEKYNLTFQSPKGGNVNITAAGQQEDIDKIDMTDFQLYIDAANLTEGQHTVQIKKSGPSNVNWSINVDKATIFITKKLGA